MGFSMFGHRKVRRFGLNWGFAPANAAKLAELPPEWQPTRGEWFMLQLKDEQAIVNALGKDFAAFMSAERRNTERTYEQARLLKTIITVIGFTIGILCFIVAGYLLVHRHPFSSAH